MKITRTAICGSDLHLNDGYIPSVKSGDILGHEFMGEVVEVGHSFTKLKKGDRVVVPFTIACGHCRESVIEALHEKTAGRGPDACIVAVGMEAYSHTFGGVYDKVKAALWMASDRPNDLRLAIQP